LAAGEGIWSVLKRGVPANLAVASFAHLVLVIRHGLKMIQYRPGLIEGCLAGTGLTVVPRPARLASFFGGRCGCGGRLIRRYAGP
jgi:hypothetical protein